MPETIEISFSKEIWEALQRRQEQEPEKTIDEIANDILKRQIARYESDPELFEREMMHE